MNVARKHVYVHLVDGISVLLLENYFGYTNCSVNNLTCIESFLNILYD